MANLYERLEHLCAINNINITELSRRSGVNRASFTDLKMGRKKTLAAASLQKIADCLGVTIEYLLTGEQKEKPPAEARGELEAYLEELATRPELRMLFSVTKDATKEDVEKAVKIIEALRDTNGD